MWWNPDLGKNIAFAPLVTAILYLGGCVNHPTDAQLEVWRKEAIARNAEIVANHAQKTQQHEWNLLIQGETAIGKSVTLNWQQLQALATDHVKTINPLDIVNPGEVSDFRGIQVSKLLQQHGVTTKVTEVTFVSFDSYYVTISLQNLLAYPIMLAIAKNGNSIKRDQGGPIYLVFPYTQYPQLKQNYNDSAWAFYVSNIVVGTEPVQVTVGKRKFDLASLDQLSQITINQTVGYRGTWPSGKVKIHGVRIRDVLALAGTQLPERGKVIVHGKAPTYQNDTNAVLLPASDVRNCDILLATRWGDDRKLIPARMGGPVTLAFSSECQAQTSPPRWVTFVEELIATP
ncbi:molybdopterin-dependent oxidoreductase [Calothrix sp. PCC 7507]|uniref:molybdopterin-dependent oxidoreductase n=1 Tax=Calothrix sp. PCC 7507 TaxID=99598 RepID=UPI00029ED852|nr:molybdopterin-dependent oxidoreductase [Calothrix sp. PCC 7507]AFY32038.1 oxidoreductase molybdopterin binding protein [Calothrix sp. PCC 7507]